MKPTIGRIVFYQRFGTPGGEHKSEPSPAVITQVFDNDECMLFVMNPNGVYFNRTPYSEQPKPGHWSWPPHTRVEVAPFEPKPMTPDEIEGVGV